MSKVVPELVLFSDWVPANVFKSTLVGAWHRDGLVPP